MCFTKMKGARFPPTKWFKYFTDCKLVLGASRADNKPHDQCMAALERCGRRRSAANSLSMDKSNLVGHWLTATSWPKPQRSTHRLYLEIYTGNPAAPIWFEPTDPPASSHWRLASSLHLFASCIPTYLLLYVGIIPF